MISLAYYLKVIAAMWMAEAPVAAPPQTSDSPRWPAFSRGRHPADRVRDVVRGALFGAATLFFGIALAVVQPGRPGRALADLTCSRA
jgi:hypothetical protein